MENTRCAFARIAPEPHPGPTGIHAPRPLASTLTFGAHNHPPSSPPPAAPFNLPPPPPQALVLDAPVIAYLVATMNDRCDLFAAGQPFETFDIAIGFPGDAPDALVADVSRWIVHLQVRALGLGGGSARGLVKCCVGGRRGGGSLGHQPTGSLKQPRHHTRRRQTEHGVLDDLENRFITDVEGSIRCPHSSAGLHTGQNVVVHIEQVAGLWIILAAMTGFGLLLVAVARVQRWLRERRGQDQPGGGAGGSVTGTGALGPPRLQSTFWGTTLSFGGGHKRSSITGSSEPGTPAGAAAPTPDRRASFASRFGWVAPARGHGEGDGGGSAGGVHPVA
jgi:hypothetical protein